MLRIGMPRVSFLMVFVMAGLIMLTLLIGESSAAPIDGNGIIRQSDQLDECAPTLSPDLLLFIPVLSVAESYYRIGLQYSPTADGLIWFILTEIAQTTQGGCGNPSTLSLISDKFVIHIPALDIIGTSYWVDFEYVPTTDGLVWVKLIGLGPIPVPPLINPPTYLTITMFSGSNITLSWVDNSENEEGFQVERKEGAEGVYSLQATVGANTTTFSDTGVAGNTTYYYRVRAYNAASGYSAYSNEATATTPLTITKGSFGSSSSRYEIQFDVTEYSFIDNLYVVGCPGNAIRISSPGLGIAQIDNGAFSFSTSGTSLGATYSVNVSGTFTDNNHATGTYSFSWTYNGTCTKETAWSATRK